jgi:radical SAM enzyme (TIGR01210 family)
MKIFVSHSSGQKSIVKDVAAKLHPKFQSWIDEREMHPGPLSEELKEAIHDSDIFMLYISKESLKSSWVEQEIEWAVSDNSLIILPIILPKIKYKDIPPKIKELHYLELRGFDDACIDALSKQINDKIIVILCRGFVNYKIASKNISTDEIIDAEKNPGIKKYLIKARENTSNLIYKIVGVLEIYVHDEDVVKHLQKNETYKATHPFIANKLAHDGYWGTIKFKSYIETQKQAVLRGAIIKRLYFLPNKSYIDKISQKEKEHLYEINETSIESRIVYADSITNNDFADDFVIFNDKLIGIAIPKKGEMLGSEYHYVMNEESEKIIKDYNDHFDKLFRFAEPLSDFIHKINNKNDSQTQIDLQRPAFWVKTLASFDKKSIQRLMIVLRTSGCAYDKNNSGCTMCDFKHHAVNRSQINNQILMNQLEYALEQINLDSDEDFQIDLLTLGSFLNDKEISIEFRKNSFKKFAEIQKLKKILIESRSEYITESRLTELKNLLRSDQILEIGLGVETSNEKIRNQVLKKNLLDPDIRRVMNLCAKTNVNFLSYLLIGSMGLTEEAAVGDAINSANYIASLCKKKNVEFRIAFEPVFITQQTKLEELYLKGDYKLINLWSVIDVIKATYHLGTIFVGMNDEGLSNDRKPSGCDECTNNLREAIEQFNATQNIRVFDELKCTCQR